VSLVPKGVDRINPDLPSDTEITSSWKHRHAHAPEEQFLLTYHELIPDPFTGSSVGSPIAFESMRFEARRGPTNKNARMMGQGKLVDRNAMWNMPGRSIAVSQRKLFHFSMWFLSDLVIGHV
jgi:hypothetical protein